MIGNIVHVILFTVQSLALMKTITCFRHKFLFRTSTANQCMPLLRNTASLNSRIARHSLTLALADSQTSSTSNDIMSPNIQGKYSDKLSCRRFHHVEFYCGDAVTTWKRFSHGLGCELVAKSDQSTGNNIYASYVTQSRDVLMTFTAPYGDFYTNISEHSLIKDQLIRNYNSSYARRFFIAHGLAVRAVGIEVENVDEAYNAILSNGGESAMKPCRLHDSDQTKGYVDIAEAKLYGDVVLRLINLDKFKGNYLPNYQDIDSMQTRPLLSPNTNSDPLKNNKLKYKGLFGIKNIDHVVGNLWSLNPTVDRIKRMTGFHEFAEFVAADVGTVNSGLNSVVLASEDETVLLPLNEPTFGTKRKSQIQTYLEQNQGEGVQHIALRTDDIFQTIEHMYAASGFEFMDRPSSDYYRNARNRLGNHLTEDQYAMIEKYGILADRDKEGTLLQIFTKPIADRATFFFEIIQRIGCEEDGKPQKPACGGFGKGNFRDLFKSIEDYETKLNL